jgi:hypothetical protein
MSPILNDLESISGEIDRAHQLTNRALDTSADDKERIPMSLPPVSPPETITLRDPTRLLAAHLGLFPNVCFLFFCLLLCGVLRVLLHLLYLLFEPLEPFPGLLSLSLTPALSFSPLLLLPLSLLHLLPLLCCVCSPPTLLLRTTPSSADPTLPSPLSNSVKSLLKRPLDRSFRNSVILMTSLPENNLNSLFSLLLKDSSLKGTLSSPLSLLPFLDPVPTPPLCFAASALKSSLFSLCLSYVRSFTLFYLFHLLISACPFTLRSMPWLPQRDLSQLSWL